MVVNVSSYAGRDPFPGLGAYGAAKAGVNLLGLALAREGAEIKVRVHTVAPSATETAINGHDDEIHCGTGDLRGRKVQS